MNLKFNYTLIRPQKELSSPTRSQDIFPIVDKGQEKQKLFFLATILRVVVLVVFLVGMVVVMVMVVRMVPFLYKRLALDDSLKWPIVGEGCGRGGRGSLALQFHNIQIHQQ